MCDTFFRHQLVGVMFGFLQCTGTFLAGRLQYDNSSSSVVSRTLPGKFQVELGALLDNWPKRKRTTTPLTTISYQLPQQ